MNAPHYENKDTGASLTARNLMVCLQAVWKIEALAKMLPGQVPKTSTSDTSHYVVRGISDRLQRLAGVMLAGLEDGDADADIDILECMVGLPAKGGEQ